MLLRLFGFHDLPPEILKDLESRFEGVLQVLQGNFNPDTPREAITGAVEPLGKFMEGRFAQEAARLTSHMNRLLVHLDSRPRLRGLLVGKLRRAWGQLVARSIDKVSPAVYVQAVESVCPGAAALALGAWPGLSVERQTKMALASALLREADSRKGEARFSTVSRLVPVVLNDLYPGYVRALCLLETVRTGAAVQVKGKQANSFGAQVVALSDSLPSDAKALLDSEAHKIRNAFSHEDGAAYDLATDTVLAPELSERVAVGELVERLRGMVTKHMELMVAVLLVGSTFGIDVMIASVTWPGLKAKADELGPALRLALDPAVRRAAPWLEAQKPRAKALPAGPEAQRSGP